MPVITVVEVEQLPCIEHPATSATPARGELRCQQLSQLALSLFDLRAACEAELRTLTSIQRSLERIRSVDARPGEADLLFGEMVRHLDQLGTSKENSSDGLLATRRCLEAVRAGFTDPADGDA